MATVLRLLTELNAGADPVGLVAQLPSSTGEGVSFDQDSAGSSESPGSVSWLSNTQSSQSSFPTDQSVMLHNLTIISEGR
jgi:hypothetical protein